MFKRNDITLRGIILIAELMLNLKYLTLNVNTYRKNIEVGLAFPVDCAVHGVSQRDMFVACIQVSGR